MTMTFFVSHSNGTDRLSDTAQTDARARFAAKYSKEDETGRVTVALPNGDIHEYVGIHGREVTAGVDAIGCLVMSTGLLYSASGWTYADGDVKHGESATDFLGRMSRR